MSELISGKEALIALANGEQIEFNTGTGTWHEVHNGLTLHCFDAYEFRLKPRTITLNGIEVSAPFEPKRGDKFYYLDFTVDKGYSYMSLDSEHFMTYSSFGAWRTEEEIKQVVAALRSVFKV